MNSLPVHHEIRSLPEPKTKVFEYYHKVSDLLIITPHELCVFVESYYHSTHSADLSNWTGRPITSNSIHPTRPTSTNSNLSSVWFQLWLWLDCVCLSLVRISRRRVVWYLGLKLVVSVDWCESGSPRGAWRPTSKLECHKVIYRVVVRAHIMEYQYLIERGDQSPFNCPSSWYRSSSAVGGGHWFRS